MKKTVVIFIHLIVWVLLYWAIFSLISQFHRLMYIEINVYLHALIISLGCVPPLYFGYYSYPKLFKEKTKNKSIVLGLVFLVLFPLVVIFLDDGFRGLYLKNYTSSFAHSAIITFMGGGLRSLFQFVEQKKKQEQLEKQNLKSELALLRIQLNPHFLFNTLHNIDTLINDNQAKASQSLIKLSEIMRYMLYDSKPEKVSLKKEIEHIENYIGLEKLRLKNQSFLSYKKTGDYSNLEIAPMLFIPYIENAFKHSIDTDEENGITIEFKIIEKQIVFSCINKFEQTVYEKDKTSGIGLDTVKKRLNLLYPQKHELKISKDNNTFSVKLNIYLNDN